VVSEAQHPHDADALARLAALNTERERRGEDTRHPDNLPEALTFHSAGDLLRGSLPLPRYDLEGLVAPGCITALGGSFGAGKTPLAVRLLRAMIHGDAEFAGVAHGRALPDGYRIVYLTQESEYTFKPLLEAAGLSAALADGRLEIVYVHEAFATGLGWPEIVAQASARVGPRGLLVVDPLADWAQVRNEDDNAVMTEAFRPVIAAVGGGRSVLVVCHAWKSFDTVPDEDAAAMHIRGAGAIVSNASIIAVYKRPKDKGLGENVRYLKVVRNRFGSPLDSRYLELDDGVLRRVEPIQAAVRASRAAEEAVMAAIEAAGPDGARQGAIEEQTRLTWRRVKDAVTDLEAAGRIVAFGKPRSKSDPVRYVAMPDVTSSAPPTAGEGIAEDTAEDEGS
jgi:hypothetical protein